MGKDYKETLNLPKTDFPMKANLVRKEQEILDFWEKHSIYQKLQQRDKTKVYILHDGPPYANGHIHIGHALNKILKDIVIKYKLMKGFYSPFVPGWDCHGLPIEHEVDKKLGLKNKDLPIIEKRRFCREYALKFLDIQREEFKRLGIFGDWKDPYLTMSLTYEGAIVREFNKFVEKKFVYKGKKPVYWCPSCVTALAEAEVEYADKESPSIYVKFKVKSLTDHIKKWYSDSVFREFPGFDHYFVAWTTTPWTLVANLALSVHPAYGYRLLKVNIGKGRHEIYIIADKLHKDCMQRFDFKYTISAPNNGEYTDIGNIKGEFLEGIIYLHPFIEKECRVIIGEHVTMDQGTGVVHTAPGHGEEDYEIGLRYGLDVYAPVDNMGRFTEDIEGLVGQDVFKANQTIINILREKNALFGTEARITHSYPHCWRCKKPVIFRATEQWFISIDKNDLRQKALEEIKRTNWIPKWGMDRIYSMVENRPDWCISRQRAWGVPITLFQCKGCNEIITDKEVLDNIAKKIETEGSDVWFERPTEYLLPKGYRCPRCKSSEFMKETDILDVWFESGVSHAAVLEIDKRFSRPADMYLEGSDQHRGWFQSSLLASVGTREKAPFQTVLTHGFVVDGEGKKMSKSLGNVVSPQEVTNKHGSEILRLWSASADYREDMRISEEILDRLVEAYRKIRNTCRFLLGNLYDFDITRVREYEREINSKEVIFEIDRLALSMLQRLIERVTRAYEGFEFHEVFHSIYNFCVVNMSAFYLDVLKDRLYTFRADSRERRVSQFVLYKILVSLTGMMAPILSFTSEEIWRFIPGKKEESVFLSVFPEVEPKYIDRELEQRWETLLSIRDEVNKALEIKRQERFIGNSLEAKVNLYVSEEIYKILKNYRALLPTLFIVSASEVFKDTQPPESSYRSPLIKGMAILVDRAEGKKCSRCWNWSPTVGSFNDAPELCRRCHEVVEA
jgi:isoleucyl-tRNA synthetase